MKPVQTQEIQEIKTISIIRLKSIFKALQDYRGDGRSPIIFDSRDRNNYSAYNWSRTEAMLEKADPTNLSIGMLINEMIEATINGSTVHLASVLRDEGFIGRLQEILALKDDVMSEISIPAENLKSHVQALLNTVNSDIGDASSRELTCCLRDAIYCMEGGLTLRWLQCDDAAVAIPVKLASAINHYPDISSFIELLRVDLHYGAHLARIGEEHTAIGIKMPGKIAYLSSIGINIASGTMEENRAGNRHMADRFDLDTAIERYPEWLMVRHKPGTSSDIIVTGQDTHALNDVSLLPRDRLIWLAMTVEMTLQKMRGATRNQVKLVETMVRALPNKTQSMLPAALQPNWVAKDLTVQSVLDTFNLSAWELRFLQPCLNFPASLFLPSKESAFNAVRVDLLEMVVYPGESTPDNYFENTRIRQNSVRMMGDANSLVGDQAEIEQARLDIFRENLKRLMTKYGEMKFKASCKLSKDWLETKMEDNVERAIAAPFAQFRSSEFAVVSDEGVHLFEQSAKHKTYNPRCFFNDRSVVTDTVLITPNNSTELCDVFGVTEGKLPEFLRGWSRSGNSLKWEFSNMDRHKDGHRYIEASVCVNRASLPAAVIEQLIINTKG